jgi:hypothetical protein
LPPHPASNRNAENATHTVCFLKWPEVESFICFLPAKNLTLIFDAQAFSGHNARSDSLIASVHWLFTTMHTSNKRELLSGIQYLLIGMIAEGAVLRWFDQRSPMQRMLTWVAIAAGLSLARFLILAMAGWTRKDDWQTVSRRNW